MTSKYLKKQVAKACEKKETEARDIAEAFRRSGSGLTKGIIRPDGDIHRLPEQNFAVISYCTADGSTRVKSVKDLAMKFGPGFKTLPEAEKWAEIIRDEDPRFDVQVVDMYEWGTVPLPDEQRPFVKSVYANEILTRHISGLQRSMIRGKKEIDNRKTREMAAAERAMQKIKGKDYKMPEKSKELMEIEARIQREREEKEKAINPTDQQAAAAAAAIIGSNEIKFTMSEITELVMNFCKDHDGEVIDMMTGALMAKYIAKKSLEIEAQIRRARASEFKEEDPRNIPTAQEIEDAREQGIAEL